MTHDIPPANLDEIEGILVDEKYLGAKKGFVTLVLNARSGEPLHMAAGKDQKSLDTFISKLTESQRKSIKFMGIDRGNAYRASANKNLPDASICYDPFHLVSNMNAVVDQVRRSEIKHATEGLRSRLVNMRYILLKAPEKLNEDGEKRLADLLAYNRTINKAYILKEQFRAIFKHNNVNTFTGALVAWISMCVKSGVKALERFGKSISACFNEIVNSKRFGISSAKIESANAGIKRIQAKSCGLHDESYLYNKIRQIFFMRAPKCSQQIWNRPHRLIQGKIYLASGGSLL